jgi:ribosome-interacting GTPase 1
MALNVRPAYTRAEEKYRAATTPEEKLQALREMLATAPKHKAAEKLLKDLKQRIARLRGEMLEQRKKRSGGTDPFVIRPQGAGQILLLGAPNVGKSALVAARTKASVKVDVYPFTTQLPVPGMAYHEDAPLQLVDTPPITPDHVAPGLVNALHHTDAVLLVVNAAADSALDDLDACISLLNARGFTPISRGEPSSAEEEASLVPVKALVACTHSDVPAAAETLATLRELYPDTLTFVPVSPVTGEHMDELLRLLFELLDVVRVYTKPQGRAVDRSRPFVLARGSTVHDLAEHIHKEVAVKMQTARVWGEGVHDGQQVTVDHVLHDRDVVELHL